MMRHDLSGSASVHQQLLDKTIRNCDFAGTAWEMQREFLEPEPDLLILKAAHDGLIHEHVVTHHQPAQSAYQVTHRYGAGDAYQRYLLKYGEV
jgi:hypothetical protein